MLLIHYVQLHQKAINLTQAEKSNRNQISQQDLKSSVRHQKKRLKVFVNNQTQCESLENKNLHF